MKELSRDEGYAYLRKAEKCLAQELQGMSIAEGLVLLARVVHACHCSPGAFFFLPRIAFPAVSLSRFAMI